AVLPLHSPRPHRHLHPFPPRRSSDLARPTASSSSGPSGAPAASRDSTSRAASVGVWPTGCSERGSSRRSLRYAHSPTATGPERRSEEHTSELQSRFDIVCRLLLEKKK